MSSNQLQMFTNAEFGTLNVLIENGREYFPATECARILGYKNPNDAVKQHCRYPSLVKREVGVQTGVKADGSPAIQMVILNYIPEGDLYRLITRSKLPAAERFEAWVFDEVLPGIRRNGAYVPDMKELVAMTTRAVVMELLPYINRPATTPPKRPLIRHQMSIIEQLDIETRNEIDELLLLGEHTYAQIVEYLAERGVRLSVMSVSRYNRKLRRMLAL